MDIPDESYIDENDHEDITLDPTDHEGVEEVSAAKLKKLREELKKTQTEKGDYLAGWQRAKADYINLKNTEDKNRGDIVRFAKEGLLTELIPLADSFDMAMGNKVAWEQAPENWRRGIEYIYNQLTSIFKDNGLEMLIPKPGDPFDPNVHESIGLIPTEDQKQDGTILEVVTKGYILQGKIIRPAGVKTGHYEEK